MSKKEEMMDIPQFSPFELLLNEARYIILYGEICDESAREVNTKLLGMTIQDRKTPIYLEINSGGGSVSAGIAIMNMIQAIQPPVITIINGEACSMAGLISVVGDKRIIAQNSYWMGHPMSDMVGGSPQTIKDRGFYLEKLELDLQKVFKDKTKLNEKEFEKMMRGELWLNAQECLAKGIVDEVQTALVTRINDKKKKSKKGKK